MKRIPSRELLDDDAGTAKEVSDALADLRLVNRWFGGRTTTTSLLYRALVGANASAVSILEVAAGSGDVITSATELLKRRKIALAITTLDRSVAHLSNGSRRVVADALALPFPMDTFDLVSCGLFTHHLSPDEVVRFAREALRVCRTAVIINDLIRHPVHLALVYAGMPFYRSRLTRHDAPASVRQAYTLDEMHNMLRQASAAKIEMSRHYLFRMGAIAWKHL